jgi:hypothetical protein
MKVIYPVQQVVSVWVGNFPTEGDFDECVNANVTKRLALQTPIESVCEIAFETKCVSLQQLIQGFSGWETFLPQVERAAASLGVQSANAALVCYNVQCEDAPELWGQLHFLGSFGGQDIKSFSESLASLQRCEMMTLLILSAVAY